MAHLIHVVEGLPEGIEEYKANMDRHSFGKGVCRLREFRFFALQYPEEDEQAVLNDFYFKLSEQKFSDTHTISFKNKESPFKHGRLRKAIDLIISVFGGIVGVSPVRPWETVKKPEEHQIPKRLINIYVIGKAKDNYITNKVYGKEEEWL